MALTTRQNEIYKAEDWNIVYQSFINADFESYDFETLRKSMIDYLKAYYPEDFNDFIESSEFIALIDLIAYMGQNISYRVDLNARENFLETAERRESVLRLARLVSYNSKRNNAASGLLKLESLVTTEDVFDSNGANLANTVVTWNDINNQDFAEQFDLILNASIQTTQKIGKPNLKGTVNGITTEQYQINIPTGTIPIYRFQSTIDSVPMDFEIASATFEDGLAINEEPPSNTGALGVLYRNDGRGNGSKNTGYFVHFKQGTLQSNDFTLTDAVPNRVVFVSNSNINNSDVWLYELDSNNDLSTLWSQVPAVSGNNVIFNSLNKDVRTLYSVNSREGDKIAYVFGDGVFAEIPRGTFRGFHRQSIGLDFAISTDDLQNITITIPYVNKNNTTHTLTATFALKQQVTNASVREDLDDIRIKAPMNYYTQNRMVNGEDYNIFPVASTNSIVKVKATNRTSSGISRYLDVVDPTAKYSSTNVFSEDGVLFRQFNASTFDFEFINEMDILRVVRDDIEAILREVDSSQYYFDKYERIQMTVPTLWEQSTTSTNSSTGFFTTSDGTPVPIGTFASPNDNRKYIKNNALIQFKAPDGQYFTSDGRLNDGTVGAPGTFSTIWSLIKNVVSDGYNNGDGNLVNGQGPVTLSELIGDGAQVVSVIPQFATDLNSNIESTMLNKIFNYEEFALRYDSDSRSWIVVEAENVDIFSDFAFTFEGDTSGLRRDSSWMIHFKSTNEVYTVTSRGLNYSFESELETRFYFDESVKIFNSRTGDTVKDQVKIVRSNSQPDSNDALDNDYIWQIYGLAKEFDGATNSRRVLVTFSDSDDDGIPDNPDQFTSVVDPTVNGTSKWVVFEKFTALDGTDQYQLTTKKVNLNYAIEADLPTDLGAFIDDEVVYFTTDGTFKIFNATDKEMLDTTEFLAYIGRSKLNFNYKHNSPSDRRINPGTSNIIDMYILTRAYSNLYTRYIQDNTGVLIEPSTATTAELSNEFNDLLNYKMLSDEIILHPVKYKPLFGEKADVNLRATFKIVKNSASTVTDTEIKTRTIKAINEYFDINNWDFGETFYFTELSAFIHMELSPYIATVIIVPKGDEQTFGSLFEIQSENNEIFISDAKVDDVEIIDALTASKIRSTGTIITN
jgi:hypothetical protein